MKHFCQHFFSQAYVKKTQNNHKVAIGLDTLYSLYSMLPLIILGLQARQGGHGGGQYNKQDRNRPINSFKS